MMKNDRGRHERNARPGYDLFFSLQVAPRPEEHEAFRGAVVAVRRSDAAPEAGEVLAARLGEISVLLLPRPTAEQKGRLRWTPVLARRRGSPLEPGGIDSAIHTDEEIDADTLSAAGARREEAPLPGGEPWRSSAPGRRHPPLHEVLARIGVEPRPPLDADEASPEVVIAVIDSEFEGDAGVEDAAFPRPGAAAERTGGNHGDLMVRVVCETMMVNPAVRFVMRRIRIPAGSEYLVPSDLAVAIAEAVSPRDEGVRPADVVLLAMSAPGWGTPLHLDAVLAEAARCGRGGRGAVIVCSSGRPNKSPTYSPAPGSAPGVRSVAQGADELGAHPDVLTVGPCDLGGRWLRVPRRDLLTTPFLARSMPGIQGRLGPAIGVVAPGIHTDIGTLADGSSQASAIVAAIAALMLRANPELRAAEVRHLLRQTTFVPRIVDVARGPEATSCSTFDRSGHNLKVGAGMVNPLAAVLSARDPVCQALFGAAETMEPPEDAYSLRLTPPVLFARWFDFVVSAAGGGVAIVAGYRRHRRALARLALRSIRAREELLWLARHLLAILTYEGRHGWMSPAGRQMEHGAMRRRLVHLVRTLRDELFSEGLADEDTGAFLDLAGQVIAAASDRDLEHAILLAFLGKEAEATGPVWHRPEAAPPRASGDLTPAVAEFR
jgi:subtilisin family serine protease